MGVGEVGRGVCIGVVALVDASLLVGGVEGEAWEEGEEGGTRPDDAMGSADPVRRDAAVAAAATLKKIVFFEVSFGCVG